MKGGGLIKAKLSWEIDVDNGKLESITVNGIQHPVGLNCEKVRAMIFTVSNGAYYEVIHQDITCSPGTGLSRGLQALLTCWVATPLRRLFKLKPRRQNA